LAHPLNLRGRPFCGVPVAGVAILAADVLWVVVVVACCSLSVDSSRYDDRRGSVKEGSYARDAADMEGRDGDVRRDAAAGAAMERADRAMTLLLRWQHDISGLFEMWNKNAIDERMRNWSWHLAALAPITVNLTSTPSEHYEPLHSTRHRYAPATTPKFPRTLLTASRLNHNHAAHSPQDGSAQVR
jgi:hypothetical protein